MDTGAPLFESRSWYMISLILLSFGLRLVLFTCSPEYKVPLLSFVSRVNRESVFNLVSNGNVLSSLAAFSIFVEVLLCAPHAVIL